MRLPGVAPESPQNSAARARNDYHARAPPGLRTQCFPGWLPRLSTRHDLVLPFTNMSGDPQTTSGWLTEDIITDCLLAAAVFGAFTLGVVRYRGSALDMKQVARDLDVRFIVEGMCGAWATGPINAQLIEAESGSHVGRKVRSWLDEIFAVQDRVVQTIVSTLVGRVQASDAERARRKPPASLAAYECVLQGNALAWDEPEAAEATKLFEKAAKSILAMIARCWRARYGRWKDDPGDSTTLLDEAHTRPAGRRTGRR
jgi:TolB-like protein